MITELIVVNVVNENEGILGIFLEKNTWVKSHCDNEVVMKPLKSEIKLLGSNKFLF